MATRAKTDVKREQLKEALRSRCRAGEWEAHKPVPPVRDLAGEFGLSKDVVVGTLRELVDEGLLYTLPRVGTFVGAQKSAAGRVFLMTEGSAKERVEGFHGVRAGWEATLADAGGSTLVMEASEALAHERAGELPPLAGVLDLAYEPDGFAWKREAATATPCVRFHVERDDGLGYDEVGFDDVAGGREAALYLRARGHERIGFLGVHALRGGAASLLWSKEREAGWRSVVGALAPSWHPARVAKVRTSAVSFELGREGAPFWAEQNVSALVVANSAAARGLLAGLRSLGIAPDGWPSLVAFDDDEAAGPQLLSALRLPWDELGRAAANLLLARSEGRLTGVPSLRRVEMKLIPRLTCRPNDGQTGAHGALWHRAALAV